MLAAPSMYPQGSGWRLYLGWLPCAAVADCATNSYSTIFNMLVQMKSNMSIYLYELGITPLAHSVEIVLDGRTSFRV